MPLYPGAGPPSATLLALRLARERCLAEMRGLEDRLDIAMDAAELGDDVAADELASQLRAVAALMRAPAWAEAGANPR
jgi:hypothetical protein